MPVPIYDNHKRRHGGLDLSDCRGIFRHKIETALRMIVHAQLPDGRRPFCAEAVDIVRTARAFRTYLLFDVLPINSNSLGPVFYKGEIVGYDVKISSTSFEGILGVYPDGAPKTLETLLAHELGHAARLIRNQASLNWNVEEVLMTELENQYRYARNIKPQRTSYDGHGIIPVKTYPW
jgi:hypothetical protein